MGRRWLFRICFLLILGALVRNLGAVLPGFGLPSWCETAAQVVYCLFTAGFLLCVVRADYPRRDDEQAGFVVSPPDGLRLPGHAVYPTAPPLRPPVPGPRQRVRPRTATCGASGRSLVPADLPARHPSAEGASAGNGRLRDGVRRCSGGRERARGRVPACGWRLGRAACSISKPGYPRSGWGPAALTTGYPLAGGVASQPLAARMAFSHRLKGPIYFRMVMPSPRSSGRLIAA